MTEAEWLACEDPTPMLQFLLGTASERKLRLFSCGCVRHVWHLLTDVRSRVAAEGAERYADGRATRDEMLAALQAAKQAIPPDGAARAAAAAAAATAITAYLQLSAAGAAWYALRAGPTPEARGAEQQWQVQLARDLFGNPFRPLPPRTWPAHVAGLAAACYAAFPAVSEQYLVLADALAELGEEEAAAHCRQPTHAKGCRVLDWVLGKE